jgi:hypothetical protein
MSVIKQKAEQCIHNFLRARNVPESQWPDLVKKTGRGMILAGVAVVVPGVLLITSPAGDNRDAGLLCLTDRPRGSPGV